MLIAKESEVDVGGGTSGVDPLPGEAGGGCPFVRIVNWLEYVGIGVPLKGVGIGVVGLGHKDASRVRRATVPRGKFQRPTI